MNSAGDDPPPLELVQLQNIATKNRLVIKTHTDTETYRCDVVIVFAFLDWVT